jgi:hypothetical protein
MTNPKNKNQLMKQNPIKYNFRLISALLRKYQSGLGKDRLSEMAGLVIVCIGARIRWNGLKTF